MNFDQTLIDTLIEEAQNSRKYRDLDIPRATLLDILTHESQRSNSRKELEDKFRKSLHNIIAPYLEDINYPVETVALKNLHDQNPSEADLKSWCKKRMSLHASSRERLPYLDTFYQTITAAIGTPNTILDLACALDPLGLPWISLSQSTRFLAYDIHKPRLLFLQTFFNSFYPNASAIHQDILTDIPTQSADCAFFFKEAHRLEKRQPGATIQLLQQLNVDVIVLTLPATDLARHHSLENYHTQLVEKAIQGQDFHFEKIRVGDELLFFIRKGSS